MFRNQELRHFTLWFLGIAALTVFLGFFINPAAGLLTLFSSAAYGCAFFIFTRARYKALAKISEQIDQVLHNADCLYLADANEGELSILHSEISKMTLRIREQNAALEKEKAHLADSLADIAHQLRTPLTSINLILSLLKNAHDEQERKNFLRETDKLLSQMDWLITSLLKLSRLDAGIVEFQNEAIDINHLIQTALGPFLILMELGQITTHTDIPEALMLEGDLAWLSEALQNLLKNCIESIGENGTIDIIAAANPLFTEITIHDSGAGFMEEDLPCLFDRFHRGKNQSATGYGIGLALCKMIITRQGGTITAKNHPQGGALFTIRFTK